MTSSFPPAPAGTAYPVYIHDFLDAITLRLHVRQAREVNWGFGITQTISHTAQLNARLLGVEPYSIRDVKPGSVHWQRAMDAWTFSKHWVSQYSPANAETIFWARVWDPLPLDHACCWRVELFAGAVIGRETSCLNQELVRAGHDKVRNRVYDPWGEGKGR